MFNKKLDIFYELSSFKNLFELSLKDVNGAEFNYPNLELKSVESLHLALRSPIDIRRLSNTFPNLTSLTTYNFSPFEASANNSVSESERSKKQWELIHGKFCGNRFLTKNSVIFQTRFLCRGFGQE